MYQYLLLAASLGPPAVTLERESPEPAVLKPGGHWLQFDKDIWKQSWVAREDAEAVGRAAFRPTPRSLPEAGARPDPHALAAFQPVRPNSDSPVGELNRTAPDILSRRDVFAQPPPLVDPDLMAMLRRIDQRLSDMEVRHHGYETRLSALERGMISPQALRAPSVLTDPLAARAAGRVVGGYDEFGRFVGFPGQQQTFAAPIVRSESQFAASMSFASAYGAGGGGCSGGSCGGRRGILGRIFRGRR